MHLSNPIRALPPFLLFLILSSLSNARIQTPAQQRRLASILAEKPMHTTALLAGAAATAMPAMPTVALRSRVLNRDPLVTQEDLIFAERDSDALTEYVCPLVRSSGLLIPCRRLREVELRELKR